MKLIMSTRREVGREGDYKLAWWASGGLAGAGAGAKGATQNPKGKKRGFSMAFT